MTEPALPNFDLMPKQRTSPSQSRRLQPVGEMKARQSAKIREIAEALLSAGFVTLDAQANALGLCRSTTWTILKGNHKSTGLSAKIISRILSKRQLSPCIRAKILEYVEKKASGHYGHSARLRRKFITTLSVMQIEQHAEARKVKIAALPKARIGHARPRVEAHNSKLVCSSGKRLRGQR